MLTVRAKEILGLIATGQPLPWVPRTLGALRKQGLAEKEGDAWVLTQAGRAALREGEDEPELAPAPTSDQSSAPSSEA